MAPEEHANGWFQKYVDQVTKELERLNKALIECSLCARGKMNKLKPATIVSMLVGLLTLIGLTAGGIYAAYNKGVTERKEAIEYMITAEAGQTREQMKDYAKKDKVHVIDKKLDVLEEKTNNNTRTLNKLDKRSEKIYEVIQDLQRKSRDSGND